MKAPWVDDRNVALLTDLYELTMLQSYFDQGMNGIAVFDLFVRRLPPTRSYLIACGLEHVLHYLENLSFSPESIEYLRSLNLFSKEFLDSLAQFSFSGDVYAVPEGTVVFANEPVLEIVAPLPQAQLIETFVMNQIQLPTMAASKASRVVRAARGRPVVDYGLRRIHGADAGIKAARAFHIAGAAATSNVLAGQIFDLPLSGTMAHSYIQSFTDELDAFRQFSRSYKTATLLVDTYDTLQGIRHVIELAKAGGSEFEIQGVRLDSGDLSALARQVREMLDQAGLSRLKIYASSSLDEYVIDRLLSEGAPFDGFGVGVHMGTSEDAPFLDTVYKMAEYDGQPRVKLSKDKVNLPGRKQVFRQIENGKARHDVIASVDEVLEGTPLLQKVMENGRRVASPESLKESRNRCRSQIEQLPEELLQLYPPHPPYLVTASDKLSALMRELRDKLTGSK